MLTRLALPLAVHAPADAPSGTPTQNGQPRPPLNAEEMKRRTAKSRNVWSALGQIVSLLMRSPTHRFHMMTDLEWMVLPAVVTQQCRVAEGVSAETGLAVPIAAVIWASVSAEVDERLAKHLDVPVRLKPEEWRSGDIVWIIETLGDPKAINAMLQHLKQNELKDRRVRIRVKGKDGKIAVGRVELQAQQAAR